MIDADEEDLALDDALPTAAGEVLDVDLAAEGAVRLDRALADDVMLDPLKHAAQMLGYALR